MLWFDEKSISTSRVSLTNVYIVSKRVFTFQGEQDCQLSLALRVKDFDWLTDLIFQEELWSLKNQIYAMRISQFVKTKEFKIFHPIDIFHFKLKRKFSLSSQSCYLFWLWTINVKSDLCDSKPVFIEKKLIVRNCINSIKFWNGLKSEK